MFSSSTKPPAGRAKKAVASRPVSPKGDQTTVEGNLKLILDSEDDGQELKKMSEAVADASVDAPLIRLVNCLLSEAVKANASDIHIEPFETTLRVRLRIDGILQEVQKIPAKLAASVASRLKIMAELDICERRVPQDGSFKLKNAEVQAEFRMSTLPSAFGEKIVLRVMSSTAVNNDLSKLSIPAPQLKLIRESIHRPDGLVLVTGPTGSGKTTTLYAALNELNDMSVSVFTAEDPIEGTLQGVTQCQVNPSVGYTFAAVLRSLLRQDPDVILVGEIRDQETAEMSIKAALTGHLVLSTLHTNCAVSTIQRLLNMGVAPYLITTSIGCIVAQRLVRRICGHCKQKAMVPGELLAKLGAGAEVLSGHPMYHGQGCEKCRNIGYAGRAPLYEVLKLDDEMRAMILRGASRDELKHYAAQAGMITLRRAGLELVREGITTIEEVLGATTEEEESTPKVVLPVVQPRSIAPIPPSVEETIAPVIAHAVKQVESVAPVVGAFAGEASRPPVREQAESQRPKFLGGRPAPTPVVPANSASKGRATEQKQSGHRWGAKRQA